MKINFKNKKVLISGGSKGIGFSIAKAFVNADANVSIISSNQKNLDRAKEIINKKNLHVFKYNLTEFNKLSTCVELVNKKMKGIDILVCNLGSGKPNSKIGNENYLNFIDSYKLNFISTVELINQTKKFLFNSVNPSILCIGSIAGFSSIGAPNDYSSSKAALINYVKNQSKILSKKNIRINMISPGNIFFKGGNWDKKYRLNPKKTKKYIKDNVPLNRFGNPDEIANGALFLSSDYANFVTGANFVIDGGQSV